MSVRQPEQLYETDFYAWTQAQAKELRRFARTRPNVPLDLAHLAEEIQDLGKSEYEAVFSLTQRIIEHLLLIEHSSATDQRLHVGAYNARWNATASSRPLPHFPRNALTQSSRCSVTGCRASTRSTPPDRDRQEIA
jgi:hypothetical protein